MHIENVIFLILSKNAYTKFSAVPASRSMPFFSVYFFLTDAKAQQALDAFYNAEQAKENRRRRMEAQAAFQKRKEAE